MYVFIQPLHYEQDTTQDNILAEYNWFFSVSIENRYCRYGFFRYDDDDDNWFEFRDIFLEIFIKTVNI